MYRQRHLERRPQPQQQQQQRYRPPQLYVAMEEGSVEETAASATAAPPPVEVPRRMETGAPATTWTVAAITATAVGAAVEQDDALAATGVGSPTASAGATVSHAAAARAKEAAVGDDVASATTSTPPVMETAGFVGADAPTDYVTVAATTGTISRRQLGGSAVGAGVG